jgi:hypothetical protein
MSAHKLSRFPCKHCGKLFSVRPYDYENNRRMYCGRPCYTATRPRGHGWSTKTDYERKKEYIARHPEKNACRVAFRNADRRGDVRRKPCFVCGAKKVEAHHWDYTKPMDVFWLCRSHHVAVHNGAISLPLPSVPVIPASRWGWNGKSRKPKCRPRTLISLK